MTDAVRGDAGAIATEGADGGTGWNKRYLYAGSALFCLAVSLYYLFCEKVPVNDGFGWDGTLYADFVQHFEEILAAGKINAYYIKRILPAILVALPSRIFNIPVTPSYIVSGFVVANILNIIIAVVFWLKTAAFLRLSQTRTIAGFLLLFICFPILKFHPYLPVLTDSFAFSTSIVMLYCYLRKNTPGLAIMVILASFMWVGALFLGFFLLFFPYGSRIAMPAAIRRMIPAAAVLVAAIVTVDALFLKKNDYYYPGVITHLNRGMLPLSIALALSYVYWCARCFTGAMDKNGEGSFSLRGTGWKSLLTGVVTIGAIVIAQKLLTRSPGWSSMSFVKGIAWCSVKQPLLFLVSGVTYYATAIIFLVLNLKACMRTARDFGFGFMLAIAFALALGLGTEPRNYINIFPFIVLVVVVSGPFGRLTGIQWLCLAGVQVLASKAWLYIGASSEELARVQAYPAQRLFMSIGTWMSDTSYLIHLCAGLAITALLWAVFRLRQHAESTRFPIVEK